LRWGGGGLFDEHVNSLFPGPGTIIKLSDIVRLCDKALQIDGSLADAMITKSKALRLFGNPKAALEVASMATSIEEDTSTGTFGEHIVHYLC